MLWEAKAKFERFRRHASEVRILSGAGGERSRRLAKDVLDPEAKRHLLSVADRYDELAVEAEAYE